LEFTHWIAVFLVSVRILAAFPCNLLTGLLFGQPFDMPKKIPRDYNGLQIISRSFEQLFVNLGSNSVINYPFLADFGDFRIVLVVIRR